MTYGLLAGHLNKADAQEQPETGDIIYIDGEPYTAFEVTDEDVYWEGTDD